MKILVVISLLLLATPSQPVLAESPVKAATAAKATAADACPLSGPLAAPTEDCAALRVAYRVEVNDCIGEMRSDANTRAGQKAPISSHISHARFVICDVSTREKMANPGD